MKKILTLALVIALLASSAVFAQTKKAPAKAKTTVKSKNGMAKFAGDDKFKAAHEEPIAVDVPKEGKIIVIPGDQKFQAFEVNPAETTVKTKTVFMIHEWWGLNNNIMREAVRLSQELNVRVVALDLYGGLRNGKTTDEASKLMQNADPKYATAAIKAAFAYYPSAEKTATIGWCFGGGWSLQAAMIGGKKSDACIMYYGMPEESVTRLRDELQCDVLFVFAKKDKWINQEVVDTFKRKMMEAGKNVTVLPYEADHAFANPSNPGFEKDMASDAHKQSLEFLKSHLGL
jgi:carboxymethylenebutenolidase